MNLIRGDSLSYTPASHEDPLAPGVLKRVLATKLDLMPGRVQMVNWSWLKAGKSFRRHYHEDMQEVFVLVSGAAEMTVDGQRHAMRSGDTAIVAPGEVHEMMAIGDEDVYYLVFGISSEQGGKTVVVDASD